MCILVPRSIRSHGDKREQHIICITCLLGRTQEVSGTPSRPDSGSSLFLSVNQAGDRAPPLTSTPTALGMCIPYGGRTFRLFFFQADVSLPFKKKIGLLRFLL